MLSSRPGNLLLHEDGHRSWNDGPAPVLLVSALGVKCEVRCECRVCVQLYLLIAERTRQLFSMCEKPIAKSLSLLVRSNRDVFYEQMTFLRDRLYQCKQLFVFFQQMDDVLDDGAVVVRCHR